MKKPLLYTLSLLFLATSCLSSSKLSSHELVEKTVFISTEIPDAPFADFNMTIYDKVGNEIPVFQRQPEPTTSGLPPLVVQTPNVIDEEVESTSAHVIIDSVLADKSMSDELLRFAEALSIQQFRFESVETEEEADYKLDLEIHDYGIGADSWTTTLFFEISATVSLIDQRNGKTLWQEEVHDLATVTKALLHAGMPQEDTQIPALLAEKSYEEIDDLLTGLAKYGADQLTLPLREAYRQSTIREEAELIDNELTVLP